MTGREQFACLALALMASLHVVSACTRTSPDPVASTTTPSAEPPPLASDEPAQDPNDCDVQCEAAQGQCDHPNTLNHCVAKCRDAARELAKPSVRCLAITFTCDKECVP